MSVKRYKGYVIGSNPSPTSGALVWKVRVKDEDSFHNGQKFVVASTHEGITLARGLNVTFLIGSVDGEHGQPVKRAVDVRLR